MIKILHIYQYMPQYNYDHWFRMDFFVALNNHPKIELKTYGFRLEEKYPDITIPYNKNKLISDIKQEFDFDIIIAGSKSRMFRYYVPPLVAKDGKEIRKECTLPNDFAKWNKTPKISLEEDYHYEINDSWHVDNGIDLILQRHYSQSIRRETIKKIWLPFAIDVNVFKPDKNIKRLNRICLVGSNIKPVYPHRANIISILKSLDYLDFFIYCHPVLEEKYTENLRNYICHVSSSSIYNITPAKIFEIIASGSLLFTNESDKYGIQYLFPSNCYCTYKEDYKDLIFKVKLILNNKEYVRNTTERALEHMRKYHSFEARTEDLLRIIKNEFKI